MSTFDANSLFQDDNESLDTVSPPIEPSVNIARDGLPIEVMNYVNDYNQKKEQEANYVAGYGLGFTGEMTTSLALSYKLNSAGRYANSVRNAKYIYNSIRGVQLANVATAPKATTIPGAVVQVVGFAGTEAAIWATGNLFGQSIRKAYGVQDKIYAGELISTAVFGSIAQPIEKGMEGFKIGERLIKSTNWKISDGLVDLGAWKAREVVIKGAPKMVSGATLGLAESALRQELAIQVFEDQESRNAWDYIISTGAGAGINGMFGVFSKTGAWGRTQANTLSQRAVDRMDEAIELVTADIDKLTAKGKGNNPRGYVVTLKKLKDKLKEHQDAREILQDNLEQFKQADEINTKVETEQPAQKPLDIDEKPPKPFDDEPEVEAPATPKDASDKNIEVFHGTPHEIKSFDVNKIGTGEGAQAFGHGLYFAADEKIAKWYQKVLSKKTREPITSVTYKGIDIPLDGKISKVDTSSLSGEELNEFIAVKNIVLDYQQGKRINKALDELGQEALDGVDMTFGEKSKGNLYKATLNLKESEMLLWDVPLEQQKGDINKVVKEVQKIIKQRGFKFVVDKNTTLGDLHNGLLSSEISKQGKTKAGKTTAAKNVAKFFESKGYKGIKYLDATSRKGDKESFNYVVFDDKNISIKNTLDVEAPATPKETPEIEFNAGGIPYKAEGTYVRFGELPEGASKNYITGKDEKGHSVYLAYKDEKTGKYILQPNAFDETEFGESIETLPELISDNRKIFEISGKRVGEGYDGEPLLDISSSKQVSEIDPSDIVLGDDLEFNIKGEKLSTPASYDTSTALKDVPEGLEIPEYKIVETEDGNFKILVDGEDRGFLLGFKDTAEKQVERMMADNIRVAKRKLEREAKDALATPKETPEATPAPKDTPVPTSKLDQEIGRWDKDWKEAVEGNTGSTVVENIIIRANKLFDNAIFNENVALRKMAGETIERGTLVQYREAIVTQIKLLNSVFAQLNSIGGRAVRANRADLEQVANRSVDSQNTAQLKEALNALKTRLDEILGDAGDDFIPSLKKIIDEDDAIPAGKVDGDDATPASKGGKSTPSSPDKTQAILEKRIAKLQKELDDLVKGTPKEKGKGKGSRTEDARIAALKNSIKNVKRYIAENEKIIKLQKEADRLIAVSKRDVPDEMQGELKGSKRKPKPDEPSPEIKKLKGQIAAAKKYFRERLRNLVKDEQKALLTRDRLELYKAIRNYTDSEIAQNATNNWIKGIRGARLIRKTSLVASITSVEAGLATGAIEVLKQYPRALATRILKRGKVGDKFAMHELEGASYAFQYLFNKEKRKQLGKHMGRAFREGEDPMFDKSSRYMDDTPIDQQLMPRGTRKVMDKAIRDAEDAALGIEGINKFLKDNLRLGRFMDILSMGARGILAADSGFKKVLFEQKALVEFRQQGTLKFPNDPAKAKAYSDELFKNAFTESDGLHILGKIEELEYDYMKITENLMMASKSNNIEDVADNLIRQRLIEPIRKMMPDSDASIRGSFTSALLETVAFTFYKTAVYTATKSFTLANPLRVTGLKLNPYNKLISDLNRNVATERIAYKRFREQLKESPNEANTKRIKKEMADSNTRINEFNTRIDRAEKRKFKYNQEVLVDVMLQIGVGGMAFGAGYAGYATGSNAFLTDAQKERNPNLARFQFMGQDYKAAAPIVFLVAIMSDLGRYAAELENKGQDGQPKNLSKDTTPLTVTIQSVVAAANEMPTNQVVRDMKTFVSERSADVVAKWISSYVPNPQQVKKITRKISNGESIADLRGASFGERLVYGAFGAGNKKIRLNMMGEPETSSHTAWHTVNRYAGARKRPYEPWEEIVAADKEAAIPIEPSSSLEGTNMKNFVDEEGIDLYYHFKLRVAEYGLQDIMNDFVERIDTGQLQIVGDETVNLGFQDFNKELRYHYKIIKDELLSDQSFLENFIDENDKPILDYINETEEFTTIDPPEVMELKSFKDLLPKF